MARQMNAENLYRRIGRLIENAPLPPESAALSPELMKWVGQADALVHETNDLSLQVDIRIAADRLQRPDRRDAHQKIMMILYKALGAAELRSPPSVQGAFIPVGNPFDAYAALAKLLGSATKGVLIVDPYLDDTFLTEFATSVSEHVFLRLLADGASVKPNLSPAAKRWIAQYPMRPLEVRLAPARALHDRAIFVDDLQVWTVTQSFKVFAKRSPAEIIRADDTGALKIAAYEAIWTSSAAI
jgi:uncharacterized protein YodC (DUF2158 family)